MGVTDWGAEENEDERRRRRRKSVGGGAVWEGKQCGGKSKLSRTLWETEEQCERSSVGGAVWEKEKFRRIDKKENMIKELVIFLWLS